MWNRLSDFTKKRVHDLQYEHCQQVQSEVLGSILEPLLNDINNDVDCTNSGIETQPYTHMSQPTLTMVPPPILPIEHMATSSSDVYQTFTPSQLQNIQMNMENHLKGFIELEIHRLFNQHMQQVQSQVLNALQCIYTMLTMITT